MGNQSFNGEVGQVAGGNIINNYGLDDLAGKSREEVAQLLIVLLGRLADARKKIYFNPLAGWMVLGAVTFIIELISGVAFTSPMLIAATMFFGVLVPYFLFIPKQRKYGRLVYTYRECIDYIEIFQHSRGWS
ncbi:hypothetical protein [Pseudomonas sp. HMWF006]|uniref:hypothetical protein n=1 Tax=Pseudomonas sp. HMWF006 TaxID=2056843 RepID=UPI000D4A0536|nr:hypothetical protein [Pseudomonas sp. HMWF006]PTT02726.1 hypothetical protein DBR24_06265 [Pseudomonas sp. HMWF006]PTT64745.1 hypothetical protein DBR26_20460 [Pseudomonas sp. HMWF007]PTT91585.1 hypothetical protein DBR29_11025 [Pseudomonas sp. HMWF005]